MQRKSNQIQPAEMKTETPDDEAHCCSQNEKYEKKGAMADEKTAVESCRKPKKPTDLC